MVSAISNINYSGDGAVAGLARGIVITGGLGGIGSAIARAFATEGAGILLVDSRADDGGLICEELMDLGAGKALCHAADISDDVAVSAAVQCAKDRLGSFDVLVNVAGIMLYREISELTGDDWRRVLGINLISAALFTGHAFREMKPGGCIVNVASVHARRTMATVAPYAAAKAGMVSLTRSAAIEGAALGIRVNAILPGAIDTPMLHASPAIKSGAEVLDKRDVGQPSDIANVAKFLASNAARFITGEDIVADNGRMGRL